MAISFYQAFLRALPWRPAQAMEALFWHVTGRKVRARNRLRMIGAQSPYAYQVWIEHIERAETDGSLPAGHATPSFSILLYDDPAVLPAEVAHSLASLRAQRLGEWELVWVRGRDAPVPQAAGIPLLTIASPIAQDAAEALNIGIATASGEFVLPLPAGTLLAPHALELYVQVLLTRPSPDIAVVYGDHDRISHRRQRYRPWFKPRWNAEMFLAQDYISPACLIRTSAARAVSPISSELAGAAVYALVLAVTQAGRTGDDTDDRPAPVHVPQVLAHVPGPAEPDNLPARALAVARHLAGGGAAVTPGPFASVRVDWPLPASLPLVSIIIPTRDQLRFLRPCVLGVLDQTSYRNFEIIIVDNGSEMMETKAFLREIVQDPRVRVLEYTEAFNFSAINNFAVRQAGGDYLCLLNNDIEIIADDWLTALMRQATRPEIGAAGAKLLYEDGSIQHAGVVIGLGNAAGHAHRYQRDQDAGYFARAHVAHYAMAVTAACLVVARAKYDAVHGLDEIGLAVAFNDVDLCLKLEKAGWHNVYVPQAVAIHHESKSRGRDFLPANIDRYMRELELLQKRWQTPGYADPLHHPHLDMASETYVIDMK